MTIISLINQLRLNPKLVMIDHMNHLYRCLSKASYRYLSKAKKPTDFKTHFSVRRIHFLTEKISLYLKISVWSKKFQIQLEIVVGI